MGDNEVQIGILTERIAALTERVGKLEKAQWFLVTAIIGFIIQQGLKLIGG